MPPLLTSLWAEAKGANAAPAGAFLGPGASVSRAALASGTVLAGALEALRGRSVMLATVDQLPTALSLLELDGVARRIVLCTPDLTPEQFDGAAAIAEAEAVVVSQAPGAERYQMPIRHVTTPAPVESAVERRVSERTEWILLTSGTTGRPKLVVHTLDSLAGLLPPPPRGVHRVWSTFYDIRRYGGLQIYLRAVLGGASLVLSSAGESAQDFLARAAAAGVTHISGTPSHFRRALMSGAAKLLDPEYVRLSGEVADQPVLDSLRNAYPRATIAHAFASTEAGVAFEVEDGLAGFPKAFTEEAAAEGSPKIELRVSGGTLKVRSRGIGQRYLGVEAPLADEEGFIATGDLLELAQGRYYFRGRRGGVINVGGLKVYPEEIEAVLNADERVRMSLVRARRNPITGAVVVADVLLADDVLAAGDAAHAERVKSDLLSVCRRTLPAHKVPALVRFVASLDITPAGKLVRPDA